jgi:hypothetical protein
VKYRIGAETLASESVFSSSAHIVATSECISVAIVARTSRLLRSPAPATQYLSDTPILHHIDLGVTAAYVLPTEQGYLLVAIGSAHDDLDDGGRVVEHRLSPDGDGWPREAGGIPARC